QGLSRTILPGTSRFMEEKHGPSFPVFSTPATRLVDPQVLCQAQGPTASPPTVASVARHHRCGPVRGHRRGPGLATDCHLRTQTPRLAAWLPGVAEWHPVP